MMDKTMILPGTRIGDYEIIRLAATGAMSEVYEASDTRNGQPVAVKILHEDWCLDDSLCARFINEASTLERCRHPGIVATLLWGRLSGARPYMVLEWLEGTTLTEMLRARRAAGKAGMPLAEALALLGPAARGLSTALNAPIPKTDFGVFRM